jgi:hypothetical protein
LGLLFGGDLPSSDVTLPHALLFSFSDVTLPHAFLFLFLFRAMAMMMIDQLFT